MNEDFEPHPYDLHESKLNILREGYNRFNNPLFIWEALEYCINHEWPTPKWVCSYVKKVAERFLELPDRTDKLDRRADFVITEILGMKKLDSKDVFDRYRIYKRDMDIVDRILDLTIEFREEDLYKIRPNSHAFEIVAKEVNLEPKSVIKIYYDWGKYFDITGRTVRRKKQKNT